MKAFAFGLNQSVRILGSRRQGVVHGLWIDRDSIYHVLVRWYEDGGRIHDDWLREEEVEAT